MTQPTQIESFLLVLQLQVEDEQGVNVCTESTLTLRRLLVWMYDPKVRLKTLAALVDFCQGGLGVCVCVCCILGLGQFPILLVQCIGLTQFNLMQKS